MANCDLKEAIFTNIDVLCENAVTGFEQEAIFCLRSSVDFASLKKAESQATQPNTYLFDSTSGDGKTFSFLKDGEQPAVVMQLKNAYSGTTTEFEEKDIRNVVNNTVVFQLWSNTPKDAERIDAMMNSVYVCILRQNLKGDEENGLAKYRVYGTTGDGLKMTACSNDPYSENGNSWVVTMTESNAVRAAMFIDAKDEDGTTGEAAADKWFDANFDTFRTV